MDVSVHVRDTAVIVFFEPQSGEITTGSGAATSIDPMQEAPRSPVASTTTSDDDSEAKRKQSKTASVTFSQSAKSMSIATTRKPTNKRSSKVCR